MKKLTNFINEAEKSKKQKEYQEFFTKKLKEFDVKSPAELSDADKKKFFNEVDKEWTQEPTNEKQVEEDYDSEEDEDSKEMKSKKESYESKDKGKDKEELYSSEDEEVEESEDDEMEEDSYNESSKKKVNEVTKSDIEKGTKVVIKGTKFDGEEGIIASEDMNGGKYIVQLGDSMKGFKPGEILVKEGVYEAKKIKEKDAKKRLEQIRKSLRREDLSYGEIAELEALSDFIEADDIELRQAAGLPEAEYDMEGNILEKLDYASSRKMEKLLNKKDVASLESSIFSVFKTLMDEGFNSMEIKNYLVNKLSALKIDAENDFFSGIDIDENILEHEKGDTAEISVTKSEMEKLHKDGKIDIDKDGVIFRLVFKHNKSMH